MKVIKGIGRLFTSTEAGVLEDAAMVIDSGRIAWWGHGSDAPESPDTIDIDGRLVTPGLVDAHTHPVYAGDRAAEIAARTAGATYAELAAAGGGIAATVSSTRAARPDALRSTVAARLSRWLSSGTTTAETKTGYHLSREGELDAVRLLAELQGAPRIPSLSITFLAAHAIPPEWEGDATTYAKEAAGWCERAAELGARNCDVFCDEGYFTVEQSRVILEAGRAAGLHPRIHADEFVRTGGAALAAELGVAAADHLNQMTEDDAMELARAGVVAVFCPVTAMTVGRVPPLRALLNARGTVALGTDHNAGTSGLGDMTIAVALAVSVADLSVSEALAAATAGSARSLLLDDRGIIETGARADIVAWDCEHEGTFAWAWGVTPHQVWLGGNPVLS
ncbi:MAG TPA: imidazolonepropionase [Actinomycetota bacterium]|nr:imidazolonepropionase [Actinomycetota bacterium]